MKQVVTGLWAAILVCGAVAGANAGDSTNNVTPDTIAYWPFNPGEELVDATGNGHTLTNTGVTFSAETAVFNEAYSSKLVTVSPLPFSTYSNLTIECFFNMARMCPPGFACFFSTGAAHGMPGSIYLYQSYTFTGDFFDGAGGFDQAISPDPYLSVGTWNHAAVVIDSSKSGEDPNRFQFYINRVRLPNRTTGSTNAELSDALLYIGTLGTTQAGFHLTGQMDDIRITAAALSPAEFLQTRTRTVNTIAYWPFNPGDELTDATGNGHTLSNSSVTFTNGAACFNSALFSGLSTASALPFENSVDQTFEFFFYSTNHSSTHRMLMMTGGLNSLPGTLLCYGDPNSDNLSYDIFNSGGELHKRLATGGINDGKWHHVALLVDSSKTGSERLKMYVDRVEQPVTIAYSSNAVLLNNKLHIGKASTPDSFFYDGQMDDVRITAAALSPSEFMSDRERTADHGCIAYWPFRAGQELEDASGNGYTLINSNVVFKAGFALFDNELFSHLVTAARLPFNDPVDLTLEYFVRTSYISQGYSALTHAGPIYAEPGTFATYINIYDMLECDITQVSGMIYNQERSNVRVLTDGEWHHVALVIERSAFNTNPKNWFRLYVDGHRQINGSNINSTSPFLANNKFYLGSMGEQTTAFFKGMFDDVRITGKALAPSEFLSQRSKNEATLLLLR